MMRNSCFLGITLAVLCALPLSAQNLFRPPPPQTKNVVTIGWRGMMAVDVSFRNLGNIAFPEAALDNESGFAFYDGGVFKDSSYFNNSGAAITSDGQTSNWAIDSRSQLINNEFNFHTYSAKADGTVNYSGDSGLANGWEIQYVRYWSNKQRLGFLAGFSFNTINMEQPGEFKSDLQTRTYTYPSGSLDPAALPQTGFSGVINRFGQGTILIPYTPDALTNPVLTTTPGTAEGTGVWGLDSSLFTFRLGPVYDLHLTKKFRVQVGGGVALVFCSSQFSALETLTKIDGVAVPEAKQANVYSTQRDSDWLFGGYVDANANYQFTERLNVFSGMQYQATEDYTGFNEGRAVDIKTGNAIFARAGVGVKF